MEKDGCANLGFHGEKTRGLFGPRDDSLFGQKSLRDMKLNSLSRAKVKEKRLSSSKFIQLGGRSLWLGERFN